MADPGWRTD